ncbi:MAG TPA: carbohydrate-binding protein [Candidatus Atribacteria bacterium]|nr:carbohydrate-binding protein [Candidatus Atribacteria bacterium]HPT77862.1 carbohydrate-binding protein [Candidatus Atribacteria bacterium]
MKKRSWTVSVKPYPVVRNSRLGIRYKGMLASFSKNRLFVYYGYGDGDLWIDVGQEEMRKTPEGYYAEILVSDHDILNLCFHDNNGHWDNNMGNNWRFKLK